MKIELITRRRKEATRLLLSGPLSIEMLLGKRRSTTHASREDMQLYIITRAGVVYDLLFIMPPT
jgi:hypothetical protein